MIPVSGGGNRELVPRMQGLLVDHGAAILTIASVVLGPAGATWAVLQHKTKQAEKRADGFDEKLDLLIGGQSDHEKRLYLVESWIKHIMLL